MKNLIYKELKENFAKINKEDEALVDEKILEAIEKISATSAIVSKEGLLGLEIYASELSDENFERYLKMMMLIIADGTKPDVFERICMLRYYRNHFEGVEAIQYLVYLMGAILMQEAQSTQLIQQVLIQLLSEKKMMEYLANIDCLRKIKEEDILSKEEMEKIFSRLDNKDGEEEVIRFDIPSDINLEDLSNNLEDLLTE